ncbi:hypothetical protein [Mesorhizobium sp. WSM4982]|uniref:hypothetical protein n=1 Tax=Mesorhizobium sp. WSM4982 TaxID=3038550 RepID=UPI0024150EF1|nr:hypothetical protein [Mesorhizobium sp. WSM4982]MDG4856393.1 hypothetical protein [Mesorhizobium sp. WSM4982]
MPRYVTKRTAERLIRAAYEYEHLAACLRHEGHESHANGVLAVASQLGKMGRSLMDKLEGERR